MDLLVFREPVNAWTHGVWMLLCIPAGIFLQLRARGNLLKQIGFAIFSSTLICCFFSSWLYHAVRLSDASIDLCARLDYMGIFLLIAGTTTPVMLVVMSGWWRWGCLFAVWSMAGTGILLRALNVPLPDEVSTAVYIMMGWTALLCYCELGRRLSRRALRPVWIGGVIYSVGAIINAVSWPVFVPGVFGAHELFHVFVMVASICHFRFMVQVVAAYEPPEPVPEVAPEMIPAYAATEQATA
jgi:hemolysin III